MKKLMNRAGLLAAAFALALAVALALNSAAQTPAAQASNGECSPPAGVTDPDNDGLADIKTPEQFNAMRWDSDGDGDAADEEGISADDRTCYETLFQCPRCTGYELANDISLAGYKGNNAWVPMSYNGLLDGNGFRITGLEVKGNPGRDGLFGDLGSDAVVKHVIVYAEIESSGGQTGVLAGRNRGTIIGSYATGKLTSSGAGAMGGLVGYNISGGKIYASVAKVEVKVKGRSDVMRAGGFVGKNNGEIRQSYAYGDVIEIHDPTSTRVVLLGFGVNDSPKGGNIDRSISYGDRIVKSHDAPVDTLVNGVRVIEVTKEGWPMSESPAPFSDGTNSCHLDNEKKVTCPTPTPTGD